MTLYEKLTDAGRCIERRAKIAAIEASACAFIASSAFLGASIAAGNGDFAAALATTAVAAIPTAAFVGASLRHIRYTREFDGLATTYVHRVETETREALRLDVLATKIAISGGLIPDPRKSDQRPDSETGRAIAASRAEGSEAPAIGEAA